MRDARHTLLAGAMSLRQPFPRIAAGLSGEFAMGTDSKEQ
jgi:hypothetical protein